MDVTLIARLLEICNSRCFTLYLTRDEESMAKGEYGPAIENAMGILVALGDIFEAERLVDIKSVHMPGSSVVVS